MVRRFEELIAWQKARELTGLIYKVSRQVAFAKDFGLRDQIQRAVVSIMSNVAEGFERGKRTEFHQFLSTAKSSCAEVRSLLYVARDAAYIDEGVFEDLLKLAQEVARILGGLRAAVAKQRDSQKV